MFESIQAQPLDNLIASAPQQYCASLNDAVKLKALIIAQLTKLGFIAKVNLYGEASDGGIRYIEPWLLSNVVDRSARRHYTLEVEIPGGKFGIYLAPVALIGRAYLSSKRRIFEEILTSTTFDQEELENFYLRTETVSKAIDSLWE